MHPRNLSSGHSIIADPQRADASEAAGLQSLLNAACDKIVGTVAAHVLAVSGLCGGVVCLIAVPDVGWAVGVDLSRKNSVNIDISQATQYIDS